MNKYFKEFLRRGLAFGGFGPIIAAIIYLILSYTVKDFSLSGQQVFLSVISTYVLAFIHAGSSIFNQIEHWSIMRALFCHMSALYISYAGCYLINSWIPFDFIVLLIFTGIFVVGYLTIWGAVYFCIKNTSKKMNEKLI